MFNNANNTYNLWNRPANQTGGVASTFSGIGTTPLQSTGSFGAFGTNALQTQTATGQTGFGSNQGNFYNPISSTGTSSYLGLGGNTTNVAQSAQTPLLGQTGVFNTNAQTNTSPFSTGLGQTTTNAFGTSTPTFGATGTTSSIFGSAGAAITGQEVAKPENTGDNCVLTNVTHGKPAFCQEEFRLAFYMSNGGKLPATFQQTQFGAPSAQSNTMFGSNMNAPSGIGLFGSGTNTSTTPTGGFGTQSSLFGTGQQATASTLFGTNQPVGTTNTGLFGTAGGFNTAQTGMLNPSAANTQLTFGSAQPSAFGATTGGATALGFGVAGTNPTGGLFGTGTTGSTAIGSSSLFGAGTTTGTTAFGAQPSTLGSGSSLFGTTQPTTGGLFGNAGNATTTGGIGFGSTAGTTTGGLFGSGGTATTGIGTSGLFGGAATATTTPTFGTQNVTSGTGTNLFGSSQTQTTGSFGNTAATTAGTTALGLGAGATNTTGGLFGTATTGTTGLGTSGLFGGGTATGATGAFGTQQSALGTGTNLFGTSQPATGGLFASGTATTPTTSGLGFGTSSTTTGGGLFGSGTGTSTGMGTSNLFGGTSAASSTPTFGTQQSTFGTASNLFGTNQTSTGGLFGTSSTGGASSTSFGGNLFGSPMSASPGLFGSQTGTTSTGGIIGQIANSSPLLVGGIGAAGSQANVLANPNFILNWDFNSPSPGLKSFWSNMAKLPPEAQELLNRINAQNQLQNQANATATPNANNPSNASNGAPTDRFGLRQALRNMGVYIPNYSYVRNKNGEKITNEPVLRRTALQELEAGLAKNFTHNMKKPQQQPQHAYQEDVFLPLHNGNIRNKGVFSGLIAQPEESVDVLNGAIKANVDGNHATSSVNGRINQIKENESNGLFSDGSCVERPKLSGYNDILAHKKTELPKSTPDNIISLNPVYKSHESINISDDASAHDDLVHEEDHLGLDFSANHAATDANAIAAPIFTKKGYTTRPTWESIKQMDSKQLSNVMDFQIIHEGFGNILWPGYTDLRGLNLDEIVDISHHKITLYSNSRIIHEVGKGLNKNAIVTLYNCFPPKATANTSISSEVAQLDKLRQHTQSIGCKFISANFKSGHWMFQVPYFIKDVDTRDASSSFGYINV